MRTTTMKWVAPLVLLAAVAGSAQAAGRKNPLDGQPAIRNKVELRRLRFEITPRFMVSLNQDYKYAFGPGAMLQFHILDWLAVGFEGAYHFRADTPLESAIRETLSADPSTYRLPRPTRDLHDEHVLAINGTMSAFASFTPWAGKFMLFSSAMLRYDMYVSVGVGMVNYDRNCNGACPARTAQPDNMLDPNLEDAGQFSGLKVGAAIGVGTHLYVNDWFGIQLELRDYIVGANPGGLDVNGDRRLTSADEGVQNNIFFAAGVTFMLPPKAKITH